MNKSDGKAESGDFLRRCPECGAPAPAGGRWYDRPGNSYVDSDPLRLLDSIDTYVTKREGGPGYSVLEPHSGVVLAHGDAPEAARAGAMEMAARLGRRRLQQQIDEGNVEPVIGSAPSSEGRQPSGKYQVPPSYRPDTPAFRSAAKRAINDYRQAEEDGDRDISAFAQQELAANPPQLLRPETGPEMKSYDPAKEEAARKRLEASLLMLTTPFPAAGYYGEKALGADDDTATKGAFFGADVGNLFLAAGAGLQAPRTSGWRAPVGSRLPRRDGYWSGMRGDSEWNSAYSEVNERTGGRGVLYRSGRVDLSPYSAADYRFEDLTGGSYDPVRADARLAEQMGFESAEAAKVWRDENGLIWHHVEDGKTLQLVPKELNDLPHVGGSSILRGGRNGSR